MTKVLLSGGCSFTWGSELSDENKATFSKKTWAAELANANGCNYFCVAKPGVGNSAIARKIFDYVSSQPEQDMFVAVMWTFTSRYDWAMPRHKTLEQGRWASISPWSTSLNDQEVKDKLGDHFFALQDWKDHKKESIENNVGPFADAIYKYASNKYHETYLSWKSIIWLQNILEKKNIKFMFTLADNTLFYDELVALNEIDSFLGAMYREIDFSKWFFFGERNMGFNQWANLNDYEYASTHPLETAHKDAYKLMLTKFNEIIK